MQHWLELNLEFTDTGIGLVEHNITMGPHTQLKFEITVGLHRQLSTTLLWTWQGTW